MPSTGACSNVELSAVLPSSTGTAISAAVETPTSRTTAAAALTSTNRLSPRRPTRTSPARPDAASIPIIAPGGDHGREDRVLPGRPRAEVDGVEDDAEVEELGEHEHRHHGEQDDPDQ